MQHAGSRMHLQRFPANARRQRGVVLLVIMLVTITFGGYFGVRALNAMRERSGIGDDEAQQILAQSKAALLAWSVTTDDSTPALVVTTPDGIRSIRPGNLPYPDLATLLTNARPSDGVRVTVVPGQPGPGYKL